MGLAFNLEEETVGVVILGDYTEIKEGDEVKTHRPDRRGAGRRRADRPGRERRSASRIDGKGPIDDRPRPAPSSASPRA